MSLLISWRNFCVFLTSDGHTKLNEEITRAEEFLDSLPDESFGKFESWLWIAALIDAAVSVQGLLTILDCFSLDVIKINQRGRRQERKLRLTKYGWNSEGFGVLCVFCMCFSELRCSVCDSFLDSPLICLPFLDPELKISERMSLSLQRIGVLDVWFGEVSIHPPGFMLFIRSWTVFCNHNSCLCVLWVPSSLGAPHVERDQVELISFVQVEICLIFLNTIFARVISIYINSSMLADIQNRKLSVFANKPLQHRINMQLGSSGGVWSGPFENQRIFPTKCFVDFWIPLAQPAKQNRKTLYFFYVVTRPVFYHCVEWDV